MKSILLAVLLATLPVIGNAAPEPQILAGQATGREAPGNPADVQGVGVIKAIDVKDGSITVHHEPITALGWPDMIMVLKVASPDILNGVKVGDKIQFTVRPDETNPIITSIKRLQS